MTKPFGLIKSQFTLIKSQFTLIKSQFTIKVIINNKNETNSFYEKAINLKKK